MSEILGYNSGQLEVERVWYSPWLDEIFVYAGGGTKLIVPKWKADGTPYFYTFFLIGEL